MKVQIPHGTGQFWGGRGSSPLLSIGTLCVSCAKMDNGTKNTLCLKTSHLWLAITLVHVNGFLIFYLAEMLDKVSNKKTLYYATSSNLCFCTTWETRKLHFPSNAVLVHCLNSTSCLISSMFFDSRLILKLLYDSLSLVINAFSHRDCWEACFNRK